MEVAAINERHVNRCAAKAMDRPQATEASAHHDDAVSFTANVQAEVNR